MKHPFTVLPRWSLLLLSVICTLSSARLATAQTIYVPGGTVGNISGSNVGIGMPSPNFRLHIKDARHSEQMTLGNATTGDFAMTSDDGGNYGLFAGVGYSGNAWLQVGRCDSATAYNLVLQASGGNVGIGITDPGSYKLAVNGTIHAKGVVVNQTGWSDYVFKPGYQLPSLSEVEAHIRTHGTLPGVPSEADVAKEGVNLGDMQSKLLAKVEELTLHLIRLDKENVALRHEIELLKKGH